VRHINYARFPGMGDLPGDNTNPNSPDYVERESILDCPNEAGTWLAENREEFILENAIEIIGDFITSSMDIYAQEKMKRKMVEAAMKCRQAIEDSEEADRRSPEDRL
jgi:hypothetical protein